MAGPLQVRGLFPTRVLAFDLEPADAAAFNAWLWAEIDRLLTPRPPAPPGQTWQTHHDLHLKPAFQPFVQLVQACAQRWACTCAFTCSLNGPGDDNNASTPGIMRWHLSWFEVGLQPHQALRPAIAATWPPGD